MSYNNWLREQSQEQSNTLQRSTEHLLVELQGLQLALVSGITMEPSRVLRVNQAIVHLEEEIHLLAILRAKT